MRQSPPLSLGHRWVVIFVLAVLVGIAQFNRVGISIAGSSVFIPKIGIDEVRMGMVYSAFLVIYTLFMIPGGWLVDRVGAGTAQLLLAISMGFFVMLTGVVGWFTTDANMLWCGLLVIRGLAGACSAPLHPAAAHVVAELMPSQGRATANGLITAGAVVGIACCFPLFGRLIDIVSWQTAFVICGAAMVAYGFVWRSTASPLFALEAERSPSSDPPPKTPTTGWHDTFRVLKSVDLWLVTLSYAAYGYFQYLFFYWMDYYFNEVLKVDKDQSRFCSFCITLTMGFGMAVGGMATDFACRRLGRVRGRAIIVTTGLILAAVFALIGVNSKAYQMVAVFLAISMGFLGMCEGVFWTTATDIGGKAKGFAGAFMNTGGNIGGFISPVVTPLLSQSLGWSGAMTVACAIAATGGLIWFGIHLPENEMAEYKAKEKKPTNWE